MKIPEFSIQTALYRLGQIWEKYPELTLPQVLRALAGEEVDFEILVTSRLGVTTGAAASVRPPELEKYTNDEWDQMITAAYLEVTGL